MTIKRDDLREVRQRKYVAKDFDSLRAQLLEYARRYYPDRIKDFSEASTGGLFLDFAAYVGDTMSFYLDHQFDELDPETAVETTNIERLLRNAGVPIVGASPATVDVTMFLQIPSRIVNGALVPDSSTIPIVRANSVFGADNGVNFILLDDIDFSDTNSDGSYKADIRIGQRNSAGTPTTFIMAREGRCVSGKETTETFQIGNDFIPFRKITLSNQNVSEIVSVSDALGNVYYNVAALTNDVIYKNVLNTNKDRDLVPGTIKVIPAPYRFVSQVDLATRKITLVFGGGNANTLEDDIIPDPSDFAISLPFSSTFSRTSINPEKLLSTKTLGVAATNTTLTITYRYGGGLNHNVEPDNIKNVKTLRMTFPQNPAPSVAAQIRGSTEVSNRRRAGGGEDAPTSDDLKALIPSMKNSQERIVTREDILARVYSLPSNFGRVFRAAVRSNTNNPLSTQLHIISRSNDQKLIVSPDTLKQNLVKYLNPYRMITDAIDVLDARVINLRVAFDVIIDPSLNNTIVMQNVLTRLQDVFDIKNFHIDQPIIISEIENAIYAINGIISINSLVFTNVNGTVDNREYSDNTFNVAGNTRQRIIFPPAGGIFEIRYPEIDVIGKVAV
jgi:hypothetical protein